MGSVTIHIDEEKKRNVIRALQSANRKGRVATALAFVKDEITKALKEGMTIKEARQLLIDALNVPKEQINEQTFYKFVQKINLEQEKEGFFKDGDGVEKESGKGRVSVYRALVSGYRRGVRNFVALDWYERNLLFILNDPVFQAARSILVEHASRRETVNYKRFAEEINDRLKDSGVKVPVVGHGLSNYVGSLLGAVSVYEHINKRPILSAIVVKETTGLPGEGFNDMVQTLFGYKRDPRCVMNEVFEYHS